MFAITLLWWLISPQSKKRLDTILQTQGFVVCCSKFLLSKITLRVCEGFHTSQPEFDSDTVVSQRLLKKVGCDQKAHQNQTQHALGIRTVLQVGDTWW